MGEKNYKKISNYENGIVQDFKKNGDINKYSKFSGNSLSKNFEKKKQTNIIFFGNVKKFNKKSYWIGLNIERIEFERLDDLSVDIVQLNRKKI